MPVKRFICPDKVEIPTEDCMAACRLPLRCLPRPILENAIFGREWRPVASASMAGKGNRQIILEAWEEYAVNPRGTLWALIGISAHDKAHRKAKEGMAEIQHEYPLEDPYVTGRYDYYDDQEKILYDYKVWGSYKVEKLIARDAGTLQDIAMQTNAYRLMIEEAGFPVEQIYVAAVPRDGGTWMAKKRGVAEEIYMIPMPMMDLEEVKDFYRKKTEALKLACSTGKVPDFCDEHERWEGRRCKGYCGVVHNCNPPWVG